MTVDRARAVAFKDAEAWIIKFEGVDTREQVRAGGWSCFGRRLGRMEAGPLPAAGDGLAGVPCARAACTARVRLRPVLPQAEALQQWRLLVASSEREALRDPDEFYVQDLVGLDVVMQAGGGLVGSVVDVLSGMGTHDSLKVALARSAEDVELGQSRWAAGLGKGAQGPAWALCSGWARCPAARGGPCQGGQGEGAARWPTLQAL
jgi:hypothetical protein